MLSEARYAAKAGCAPSDSLEHFEAEGWKRGLNPHALFDTAFFIERYGNRVAGSKWTSPFSLYDTIAQTECPLTTPFFQLDWYRMKNPDVVAAGVDPLLHYAQYGAREGRQANPWYGFAGFELSHTAYFNEFDSLDDWIERADNKKVVTSSWIESILNVDQRSAHTEFWRARFQNSDQARWPLNPEIIFGGIPELSISGYLNILSDVITRQPKKRR